MIVTYPVWCGHCRTRIHATPGDRGWRHADTGSPACSRTAGEPTAESSWRAAPEPEPVALLRLARVGAGSRAEVAEYIETVLRQRTTVDPDTTPERLARGLLISVLSRLGAPYSVATGGNSPPDVGAYPAPGWPTVLLDALREAEHNETGSVALFARRLLELAASAGTPAQRRTRRVADPSGAFPPVMRGASAAVAGEDVPAGAAVVYVVMPGDDPAAHIDRVIAAMRAGRVSAEGIPHVPMRGSDVEAFIRRARNRYGRDSRTSGPNRWTVLDALLDEYREHADTGTPLGGEVEADGQPADDAGPELSADAYHGSPASEPEPARASTGPNVPRLSGAWSPRVEDRPHDGRRFPPPTVVRAPGRVELGLVVGIDDLPPLEEDLEAVGDDGTTVVGDPPRSAAGVPVVDDPGDDPLYRASDVRVWIEAIRDWYARDGGCGSDDVDNAVIAALDATVDDLDLRIAAGVRLVEKIGGPAGDPGPLNARPAEARTNSYPPGSALVATAPGAPSPTRFVELSIGVGDPKRGVPGCACTPCRLARGELPDVRSQDGDDGQPGGLVGMDGEADGG